LQILAVTDEPSGLAVRAEGVGSASLTLDDRVLRALYEEHASALLGFAARLTNGDRGWAEDVVQETLLRAWQHPEAVAEDRPLRPWLFTVARHLVVDGRRARRSRPPETGADALEVIPASDEIDRALQAWVVSDALATLPADQRAALVETYYRGKSVAEAARALGIPEGTVKSRTYYALRALRRELQDRGLAP